MTSKVWIGLVFVGKNILTFIRSNAYAKVPLQAGIEFKKNLRVRFGKYGGLKLKYF